MNRPILNTTERVAARAAPTPSPFDEWPAPNGFAELELPPFPTQALPSWLRDFVEAEAQATQTPVDLAAMLSLAVCSAAVAKKLEVQPWEGWREPTNIYAVVALPPAARKSVVFRDVTAPLVDYEADAAVKMKPAIVAAQQERRIQEKVLRGIEDKAAKANEAERKKYITEASRLATEMELATLPTTPRLLADDITPEKLASLLCEQQGRIAVMSPEGGPFDMMAGRYSKDANFDVFLKGHAGDEIRVDRHNRTSEHIGKPAITMGLAVQPDIIRGLASHPTFRGRGLLGRFLYALPKSNIGARAINPPSVPDTVRAAYESRVNALLAWEPGKNADGTMRAMVLKLAPEALDAFKSFAAEVEPQLSPYGRLGGLQDWGGKLCGAILRIVGILGINKQFLEPSIYMDASTVNDAITIGRYLIEHAIGAYAVMGTNEDVEKAKHVLGVITRKGWNAFTERDLYQAVKGDQRFKEASSLSKPLSILEERYFIRPIAAEAHRGPGRPASQGYEVNPHNSQNSQNPL